MILAILLLAQAGAGAVAPDKEASDLRTVGQTKSCTSGSEEIVVCGRKADNEEFRLRPPTSDLFTQKPLSATIGIGKGTLGVEGDQETYSNGETSKRVMLKVKVPF